MTPSHPLRILFLSTHNAARSIMAEYLLRRLGHGRFETCSAGLEPRGQVHPMTLKVLSERYRIEPNDARSKSWEELQGEHFDLIITLRDKDREAFPRSRWEPIAAHWNQPDPADFEGDEKQQELRFIQTGRELSMRLDLLCALPMEKLGHLPHPGEQASAPM
ncbi:arsenate reductase ArsC [Archangium minus]|uniref:Arsenate reductase ArsC n=1 Tax=Archangium minus TaxID=83450 RepID=A0ABY9WHZ9_9BACT|nr:arsenate reductase ArsC [Archangium minus]